MDSWHCPPPEKLLSSCQSFSLKLLLYFQVGLPLLPTLDGGLATIAEASKSGDKICICNDLERQIFEPSCASIILDSKACGVDTTSRQVLVFLNVIPFLSCGTTPEI